MHPDDFAGVIGRFKRKLDANEILVEGECRVYKQSGEMIWILIRGKLISRTRDDKPEWVIGVLMDVTKHKENEQRLQVLEEAVKVAPFGFSIADMRSPRQPADLREPRVPENYRFPRR